MKEEVFIGVPAYGNVVPEALPGLVVPTWGHGRTFTVIPHRDSLLAKAFNWLVCRALNEMRIFGWTHFLLHHADIGCEIGFLDRLLTEYHAHDLDVLSAVIPLKDDSDHVSMALKSLRGPGRNLTMAEVRRYPTTFDIESVAHEPGDILLYNTGLMLFDLRRPWVRKWILEAPFTIRDWVVENPETGDLEARCISEDWGFSAYCHQHGIRVKATRAVVVHHHGGRRWSNQ